MVTHVTVIGWARHPQRASSRRNAVPLLVGHIGDAVVGDHWSPRVRHAAVDVEAGTEDARDLAVGLLIPTRVVRTGLTGREDHRGGIGCVVDAHALRGEGHALGPSRHQLPNRLLNWTGLAALATPALSSATPSTAPTTTRAPLECDSRI